MDNPINMLITKDDVENILNYFGNIGLDGSKLTINNLEPYRIAFTHESYYQSIQKNLSTSENVSNSIYLDYIPEESNETTSLNASNYSNEFYENIVNMKTSYLYIGFIVNKLSSNVLAGTFDSMEKKKSNY